MNPKFLIVSAGVRYWEDATVNGVEDVKGDKIPFRSEDYWKPIINLETGHVVDWPAGVTADVHYKVCDDGSYFLADEKLATTHKWAGDYVPDRFLCHGDNGYGDYIIMKIGPDGKIADWRKPEIEAEEWEAVS